MLKLVVTVALAMVARPSPETVTAPRTCSPIERTTDVLGPADAPLTVDLYLDPVNAEALPTWLELRRLVHEHAGELYVRGHVVRGADQRDRRVRDRVRAWVLAAAAHGRLLPALRVLARQGTARVHARLNAREARPALSREIDLEPSALARELAADCAPTRLDETTDALARLRKTAGGWTGAVPVFVIDHETIIEDGSRLERLRPELANRGVKGPPASPPPALKLQGISAPMIRPAVAGGIKLGGAGLPHRMLIFASGEQDPSVHAHFSAVLRFRAANPGILSVQLVARGRSLPAQRLADRLCAARTLGRELDYARYLAGQRAALRAASPSDAILLRDLDEAVASGCDPGQGDGGDMDDTAGSREGLRDGPWIDGTLRTGPDLDRLDRTLRLLEAAQRPLGPLLTPRSRDEP
jgi:hypothetical protein